MVGDSRLHNYFQTYFSSDGERNTFIEKCFKRITTRRMLLRINWYGEIADGQEKVRRNRPALQIIFLLALAEGIMVLRKNLKQNTYFKSEKLIKEFFERTSLEDRGFLLRHFRRAYLKVQHHSLRYSSIISILWNIRNKAAHGVNFYSFSMLGKDRKKDYVDGQFSDFGVITVGSFGKRGKTKSGKPRKPNHVQLDISMTYQELKDIIIRTAINVIKEKMI